MQTYVLEHNWPVLADAMRRELERGGQVYYLHNRVETIDRTAARIQQMLGEDAAVGVAHGKMTQEAIDDVMSRMTDGELNVLVCTTIIETGIDLPNAYTSLPVHVIPQTFLLMPLVVAAINLLQMTVSLFVKPLISFIITTAILLLSAYYTTPILIGNYSMPLRSDWMLVNGVNFTVGIVFSVVLILVCVMVGGVVFQRRDILKGEEDG